MSKSKKSGLEENKTEATSLPDETSAQEECPYVEFVIEDQFDTPVPEIGWQLIYPDGKEKKYGNLNDEGKVHKSPVPKGSYTLKLEIVSNVQTVPADKITLGDKVKLKATVHGFDDGTAGTFEIYDAHGLGGAVIETVSSKVKRNAMEAAWKPTASKLEGIEHGAVLVQAKVGDAAAASDVIPIEVKHAFKLKGAKSRQMKVRFTGGHEQTFTFAGTKGECTAPLGEEILWIDLPNNKGDRVKVSEPELDFLIPEA